jgi:hypothetical protein
MEQLTLWEPEQTANLAANPIWNQLGPAVKTDAVTKLSLVMVKAVNPNHDDVEKAREDNHDE